ncbi:MAG: hypothetical protein ABL993_02610 [Vicinamibacterales bacterium]
MTPSEMRERIEHLIAEAELCNADRAALRSQLGRIEAELLALKDRVRQGSVSGTLQQLYIEEAAG